MNSHHTVQSLTFDLNNMILKVDGLTYSIPINQASEKLTQATEVERRLYKVSPSGYGIHWLALDEDLSIDGLICLANRLQVQELSS